MSEKIEKLLFKFSCVFILSLAIFSYGVAVGRLRIAPFNTIQQMYSTARSYIKYGRIVPENQLIKVTNHLLLKSPDDSSGKTFAIHHPESMMEGYYIFQIWDDHDQLYSAVLYDHLGNLLFTWKLDYYAFDPDGPLNGSDGPHGFSVFPDGSVLVNYDRGDVMARVDSCGKPVWVKKGVFHHSLQQAEDGSFWTWRGEGSSYSQYQYLLNFNAETGETIREIGLVEDLIQNNEDASAVFLVRPDYPFKHFDTIPPDEEDIFHPNDIDVLYSDIAPLFPDFEAGDLLISLKKLNLVAVFDPESLAFKWWAHGPWRWQHDPDYTSDGKISVYNNNPDLDRSEILKIDPKTGKVSNDLYNGEVRFYSESMGKHQYLPNGNIFIVIPEEGRVLVVTATGNLVMEYNNISAIGVGINGIVNNGLWVPNDYFNTFPVCLQ
jgi:hypothetical protein